MSLRRLYGLRESVGNDAVALVRTAASRNPPVVAIMMSHEMFEQNLESMPHLRPRRLSNGIMQFRNSEGGSYLGYDLTKPRELDEFVRQMLKAAENSWGSLPRQVALEKLEHECVHFVDNVGRLVWNDLVAHANTEDPAGGFDHDSPEWER